MIYIFEFKHKIKIGFSTNVDKRVKSVAAAVGEDVLRIYKHQGGKDLEKHLHNVLKEYRTKSATTLIYLTRKSCLIHSLLTTYLGFAINTI